MRTDKAAWAGIGTKERGIALERGAEVLEEGGTTLNAHHWVLCGDLHGRGSRLLRNA